MENIGKHLGNAAGKTKRCTTSAPRCNTKCATPPARHASSTMQPVEQEGRLYFMTGVRDSGAEGFYLRIPADDAKPDAWFALRALLTDPTQRHLLSERFAKTALKGEAGFRDAAQQLTATSDNTLSLFAQGGYGGMDTFIRDKLPKDEQQKAAEVFIKVLQGLAWEGRSWWTDAPSCRRAHRIRTRPRLWSTAWAQHFRQLHLQRALLPADDRLHRGQGQRHPGHAFPWPQRGLSRLRAARGGVFFMLYVRERRAFVLIKPDGTTLFAMSANRKTLDFDEAFARHSANLNHLLSESMMELTQSRLQAKPDALFRRRSPLDWLAALLLALGAGYVLNTYGAFMDVYEKGILLLCVPAFIALAWRWPGLRNLMAVVTVLSLADINLYHGDLGRADQALLPQVLPL